MIDTNLSVILHLPKGGKQALCIGNLRRHGDKLLATPTLVGPAFSQFTSAEIDESASCQARLAGRLFIIIAASSISTAEISLSLWQISNSSDHRVLFGSSIQVTALASVS
jgi:hypothetical protein